MKKSTMIALVSLLNGEVIANPDEIKAELEAELNKGAEVKAKNAEDYAVLHDIVLGALTSVPVTLAELWESIEGEATALNFTKGKVQYGMTKLWNAEIVKIEGKPNTYRKA